jgi:DNA mismatch repair protein MutS
MENFQEKLLSIISQYDPVELIIPPELKKDERFFIILTDLTGAIIKTYQEYVFNYDEAYTLITRHFKIANLEAFGLESLEMAVQATGGLLAFLKETQRDIIPNIFKISVIQEEKILHLDYITQRNLELIHSLWDKGKDATLYSVFNHTHTPMGARLLRKFILQPLVEIDSINNRLNIVQKFKDDIFLRSELREELKVIGDLERFINKLNYIGRTNARDLINIRNSLNKIPKIKELLIKADIPEISLVINNIKTFDIVKNLIEASIKENPPITIKEGSIIKDGYEKKVDELRDILYNGKKYMLEYEQEQKKRWKLTSGLKVSHNNILGYYIEITLRTLTLIPKLPEEYIERATLKNAKRYTTKKLKELEEKIINAEDQINSLEYEIFSKIRETVEKETVNILETANNIAVIDALTCFAEIAEKYDYCRPIITDNSKIVIKDGRHPVIEQINLTDKFIPNDCYLDNETDQLLIITGPNMAGKCVQEDTYIFSEKGILPIKWFKPKDIAAESFKDIKIKLVGLGGIDETSHFYSDGLKPSIKIKSRLGYFIEGSENHPILVRNSLGKELWKLLSDVSKEDYIIINRKNNLWGNKTTIHYIPPKYDTGTPVYPYGGIKYTLPTQIDEDLAYLFGLLIGDGTLTYKNSFSFTSKDKFLKYEFYRIIEKLFGYKAKSKKEDKSEHFVSSLYIRDFLYFLGLDYVTAYQKIIPVCLLRAPKKIIIALLQGLFDTDGTADNRYGNVSYSTTSIKLATQMHSILLNFGIIASLKPKKTSGRVIYNVNLYGEDSLKFYQEISFRLPRKSKRKNLSSETRMTNIDSIPYLEVLLKIIQKQIVENSEIIPHNEKLKYNKKIGGIFYSYIPQNRNISFHKLKELIDYCQKYGIICDELVEIYQNNFFYDKIGTFEKSHAELYDFTIPRSHAFIGNGFINHNSTFLRQVALICLIAQMGCFVPAKSATIGLVDQIFTRIGASDDLARKLSTFMIEMTETAKILHYATSKSLIIIDELGRGTSTSDGQSIAMATLEKLNKLKVKTLFSTHYHQLTEINLPGVKNFHLDIIENDDGSINFVRKLKPGSTDKSYGIHVAKLAGIPDDVIIRAFEILEQIEQNDPFRTTVRENGNKSSSSTHYDKILNGKKFELEKLNNKLKSIEENLDRYSDDLAMKEKELERKNIEIKELDDNLKEIKANASQTQILRKKKYVQTSLFETSPKNREVTREHLKNLINYFKKFDIDTLTPNDLKAKLHELKKKIENNN